VGCAQSEVCLRELETRKERLVEQHDGASAGSFFCSRLYREMLWSICVERMREQAVEWSMHIRTNRL